MRRGPLELAVTLFDALFGHSMIYSRAFFVNRDCLVGGECTG